MKISVDNELILELSDTQKKVIMNEIPEEIFEQDMKRRIHYILTHKYEMCFRQLKEEWDVKLLKSGVKAVPTDPEEYARLVFSQSEYKNRSQRDKVEK